MILAEGKVSRNRQVNRLFAAVVSTRGKFCSMLLKINLLDVISTCLRKVGSFERLVSAVHICIFVYSFQELQYHVAFPHVFHNSAKYIGKKR